MPLTHCHGTGSHAIFSLCRPCALAWYFWRHLNFSSISFKICSACINMYKSNNTKTSNASYQKSTGSLIELFLCFLCFILPLEERRLSSNQEVVGSIPIRVRLYFFTAAQTFVWLLVKMQIVEWDFKVILSMRMQYHA